MKTDTQLQKDTMDQIKWAAGEATQRVEDVTGIADAAVGQTADLRADTRKLLDRPPVKAKK